MKAYYNKNSAKSGIYKIVNTSNGRSYIGKAKVFRQRFYEHKRKLLAGSHANSFLQADFNKCGAGVFEYHVLEVVAEHKDRNKAEERWIAKHYDKQKQCYNFTQKSNALPRRVQSNDLEVTRKLLSEAGKAAWADPEIRARRMKTMRSKEFRKKQSETQKRVSQDPSNGNSADALRKNMAKSETKTKLSKKLKEAWANDDGSRRKAVSKVAKKVYAANKKKLERAKVKAKSKHHGKARSPDGEVFDVYNLDGFCREHSIKSSGNFWNMMHGKAKSCQGWKKVS